jgi:hypothetical protein
LRIDAGPVALGAFAVALEKSAIAIGTPWTTGHHLSLECFVTNRSQAGSEKLKQNGLHGNVWL